ncbi:hypothetical protein ABEI56_20840 [Peribacillus castrilensis]|uniref:hypothetical protein n=1 Tax=Peribacillus castrilensis TaxID=2897690 RepID=UPI003D2B1A1C
MATIFYGIGFGVVQPALQAWSLNTLPEIGRANATFYTVLDLGIGFGAIIFDKSAICSGIEAIT